jgi:UDP-N-acetylmuramate dehydrogenase
MRIWFEENADAFSGTLAFEEPLSRHTWYRIGGPGQVLAAPRTIADLQWLAEGIAQTGLPSVFLGMGSNVLISDRGFRGVVINTGKLNLELTARMDSESIVVRAGASVAISSLLRKAAAEGWGGLEFLTGIPGSVGGVIAMNGGTHLGEAKDHLLRVEAFRVEGKGELLAFLGPQLRFDYRRSLFLPPSTLVWAAEWRVERADPAKVKFKIDETLARRKATQPIDQPSCGSVFKNPRESGKSAWQVIEALGLRGRAIGGARFSEKHCNFIVNEGNATAADVRGLIDLAKAKAQSDLGIALEEEVRYLGDW